MSYSDKELQLATQIAYMNISDEDIEAYREATKTNGYPTLQWLLTESDRASKIEDDFMSKYGESDDEDSIKGFMREAAETFIEEIKNGTSECANWKIVSVCDQNKINGLYGCLIETSENEAIIGFRGSESDSFEQFVNDWVLADFGLANTVATEQQRRAKR